MPPTRFLEIFVKLCSNGRFSSVTESGYLRNEDIDGIKQR